MLLHILQSAEKYLQPCLIPDRATFLSQRGDVAAAHVIAKCHIKRPKPFLRSGPQPCLGEAPAHGPLKGSLQPNIMASSPRRAWLSFPHLQSVRVCALNRICRLWVKKEKKKIGPPLRLPQGLAGAAASWVHKSGYRSWHSGKDGETMPL